MAKRGTILLKETGYLLLAIIILIAVIMAVSKAVNLIQAEQGKAQAQGTLDRLAAVLEGLKTEENASFLGYAPAGWWLVSYAKNADISECFYGPCICICKEKDCSDSQKRVCKDSEKAIMDKEGKKPVESMLIVALTLDKNYEANVLSYPSGYKLYQPSDNAIDRFLESKYPALKGLGKCIQEASARTNVPASLIIAVAVHESNGGTSDMAKMSCYIDPTKPSNNLFGITGTGGTAGYCNWKTKECLDESEKAKFKIVESTKPCDADCGSKKCYWVERAFKAYHDRCESINDFADLMIGYKYRENVVKYSQDAVGMAKAIGAVYATDPKWGEQVAHYVSEINKGMA